MCIINIYQYIFFQLWLAFVVTMPCLAPGMSFGYSAIILDQLHLSVAESSWFGIYLKYVHNIIYYLNLHFKFGQVFLNILKQKIQNNKNI